jgi:DNA primase
MNKIKPEILEQIKQVPLYDVVDRFEELTAKDKRNKEYKFKHQGNSFLVTPKKNMMLQLPSGPGYGNPVSYLVEVRGMQYMEAIKATAEVGNIILEYEEEIKPQAAGYEEFLKAQLFGSGLTEEDNQATILTDEGEKKTVQVFTSGTVKEYQFNNPEPGPDVLIHYIGLDRKPILIQAKTKTGKPYGKKFPYVRARWKHPEAHPTKFDKAPKYSSPPRSGSHLFIPEKVREAYHTKQTIETLYLQEGEKKALKATKHGLMSIGLQGIHNLANNKTLPPEFELILSQCHVKNVVFLFDSDFQDISSNLEANVDQRPKSFFAAAANFLDYFSHFKVNGEHLYLYIAAIQHETLKGIDDILTLTYQGKEQEFLAQAEKARKDKTGQAEHIRFWDITLKHPKSLYPIWNLHTQEAFFQAHEKELSLRQYFIYRGQKYRVKDGKFELSEPVERYEQFWSTKETRDGDLRYTFNYERAYIYLQNRGFARLRTKGKPYFIFVREEGKIIREIRDHSEIKDYVIQVTRTMNNEALINMLHRGGKQYFGPESLKTLNYTYPEFYQNNERTQHLFFKNQIWAVTPEGIKTEPINQMKSHVWADQIKSFEPTVLPPLFSVEKTESGFEFDVSQNAEQCEFYQFLLNVSDNYHQIDSNNLTEAQIEDHHLHFLNKVTALGYLLHEYRDPAVMKMVIAMDGKISDVFEANGRTGKSLFGIALEHLLRIAYIDGKKLESDRYPMEEVNERTQLVVLDDLSPLFQFETLLVAITGKFQVEGKGVPKYTIPQDKTPKLYGTTNHAIKGDSDSYRDRQHLIQFSDFYSAKRKPSDPDQFGHLLFDDWGYKQWNLFYNFAATAIHIYLKIGLVGAPSEDLRTRRLMFEIGPDFIDWADTYFTEEKLDTPVSDALSKSEAMDNYYQNTKGKRQITPTTWKKKLKKWCQLSGYIFNPGITAFDRNKNPIAPDGGDIKSGGIEKIIIGTKRQ